MYWVMMLFYTVFPQLIQTFSSCVFGVSGDMDAIRILYFMIENFPEYKPVYLCKPTPGLRAHFWEPLLEEVGLVD